MHFFTFYCTCFLTLFNQTPKVTFVSRCFFYVGTVFCLSFSTSVLYVRGCLFRLTLSTNNQYLSFLVWRIKGFTILFILTCLYFYYVLFLKIQVKFFALKILWYLELEVTWSIVAKLWLLRFFDWLNITSPMFF